MELIQQLESYKTFFEEETNTIKRFFSFLTSYSNCFDRELLIGHITASAFIYDRNENMVLLIHHKKLGRWLQPGGHCDGDKNTLRVAAKEVLEETGIKIEIKNQKIFDLDIHIIPEKKGIPEHLHYDVRYLFEASCKEELIQNHETNKIEWVQISNLENYTTENSIIRMARKIDLM